MLTLLPLQYYYYSELIDEGDENSSPVVGYDSTPRKKLVPMKKPLMDITQQSVDKHLEEIFVEPLFFANPQPEEEIVQLNEELVKNQMEVADYKKAEEIAKKRS
uniref:Uncharacterized protein n=1 Tax=Panagrolaimus superbus TaxID=310955 RepID=A0A914Y3P7_9BILA